MELDEYGLSRPSGFDDDQPPRRQRRGAIVVAMVLIVGLVVCASQIDGDKMGKLVAKVHGFTDSLLGRTPQAIRGRMLAKLRRGDLEGALAECAKLREIEPVEGRWLRTKLLGQMGRYDEAVEEITGAIEARPDDAQLYLARADLLGRLKRFEESVVDYTKVIALDPTNATAYNNRAYNRALARVDLDQALEDVQKALTLAEEHPQSQRGLAAYIDTRGYLFYLQGNYKKALADFDSVLNDLDRHNSPEEELREIFFHRALVYEQLGETELAKRDFDLAERLGLVIQDRPLPVIAETKQGNGV